MELTAILIVYILTILLPINGLILVGIVNKTKKNRQLLLQLWRFYKGGKR